MNLEELCEYSKKEIQKLKDKGYSDEMIDYIINREDPTSDYLNR